MLPTLEEISAWEDPELNAALAAHAPPDWTFQAEEKEGGVWIARFLDAEGELLFETSYPDKRIALLNAYGYLWHRLYKPQNPVWQRRRDDLRDTARRGLMHLPGSESVPDPGDLDPSSVYDPDPTRKNT